MYPCKDRFCNRLDLYPLGWTQSGNGWKMAVAAISGLIAKENVVATFGMLFGFAEVAEDGTEFWGNLAAVMTPVAAYGYLVFNLLCAPCFAAMGAIKREMNNTKWFWFAIGYQCGLAYVVSLCIYQIGTLITTGTFGIGTVVAFVLVIGLLYLLFRPYKESDTLKSKCKRHGRRKISTASKVAAVCVDMAAIFIIRRKTRRKILCSCRGTCYAGIAGIFLRKTRRKILCSLQWQSHFPSENKEDYLMGNSCNGSSRCSNCGTYHSQHGSR